MKELEFEIYKLVKSYFDKKLEGFNFWEDPLEDEVFDKVANMQEDIVDLLNKTEHEIDCELEEFNAQIAKRNWVANKKAEIKRNMEIDRSFGLI